MTASALRPGTRSVAVVVATYRRPAVVERCLEALEGLTTPPDELVVVDASPDELTRDVVALHPGVVYLRNEAGMGTTATSRAIGTAATSSEVVAFIDDDSIVRPTWLEDLVAPYEDARVGAVGGRVINSPEEVAAADPGRIGRLLPDGRLTGNFAADPGRVLEVDHLLGANMSYRRTAIAAVGGIREFYPGRARARTATSASGCPAPAGASFSLPRRSSTTTPASTPRVAVSTGATTTTPSETTSCC